VQLTLRPAAQQLVTGGVPRSRLPLLLLLLAVTGALIVIANRLARRSQELAMLRADFTSSVSHELRTPLAQILLFGEMLEFGRIADERERREANRVIVREARRLTHLLDNVLLFSRMERRAVRLSPHPEPLAPFIQDVTRSYAPLARQREARIETVLDPAVVAPVDPSALRQMLLNLLDNAVKYGPTGQRVVVGLASTGVAARIWVDDQGPGVPAAERERIWEPFVRLEQDEETVDTGSGIGLSVVRRLVTLHGGRCWAEASPTCGARFVIEMPLARDESHRNGSVRAPSVMAAMTDAVRRV
jgi:signal transduction histidine kinase